MAAKDKAILWSGIIGLVITTICCAVPVFVLIMGAASLSASLAGHDYILLPALILILAMTAYGLFLRRRHKEDDRCR